MDLFSATPAVAATSAVMAMASVATMTATVAAAVLGAVAAVTLATAVFRLFARRFAARGFALGMTRRVTTMVAMVPAAAATPSVGLRFQANEDKAHRRQTQGPANQISIHQITSYETSTDINSASIDVATSRADSLAPANAPDNVAEHGLARRDAQYLNRSCWFRQAVQGQ